MGGAVSAVSLPCWLKGRDKYVVECLLRDGLYQNLNYESEDEEELDYFSRVCGYKVGFPGCENYICVVVDGCELCLYLGDSVSQEKAELALATLKKGIKKYCSDWESVGLRYRQLSFL